MSQRFAIEFIESGFFTGVDADSESLGFLGLTDDPAPDGECWEGVRSWTAGGFLEAGYTSGHGHCGGLACLQQGK
jgi:hypothetical protein